MLRRVRCRLICAIAGEHAEIPVDVEDFGGIVKKIKRSITHAHLHGPCGHVHVAVGNTTTMQVMSDLVSIPINAAPVSVAHPQRVVVSSLRTPQHQRDVSRGQHWFTVAWEIYDPDDSKKKVARCDEHQRLFGSGYNRCRRCCGTQLDDSDADMDDDDPGPGAQAESSPGVQVEQTGGSSGARGAPDAPHTKRRRR